jgi:hypothetical protein
MAPQFDKPLRDLLRAAGCTLVRQGKGSHEIWHSPLTKRNFAGDSEPPHRQCDSAPSWIAEGFLSFVAG